MIRAGTYRFEGASTMPANDARPSQPEWHISPELRLQLLAALSTAPGQTAKLTYEEFLDWADEDTCAEWVDGEIVVPSPASERHQDIVRFLITLLSGYVEFRDQGKVYPAPFQMKLARSGREPDVLFISNAHLDRLKTTYLEGPADLVVEVISPESVGRDRGEKFYEYQKAGVPEYWLIEPESGRAEFYQLNGQGEYRLIEPGTDGRYHSRALPGFWLRDTWLRQLRLPRVDRLLAEIGGPEYIAYLTATADEGE
jgi:Uma2 family endonuclease